MSTEAPVEESKRQGFSVDGMTCTACASRIQKVLSRTDGVQSVRVNFATETAGISYNPNTITQSELEQRVRKLGYEIKPAVNELLERKKANLEKERRNRLKDRILFAFSAVLTLPLVLPMIYEPLMLSPFWQWILATPVQIFAGFRFYKGAYHSLKSGAGNMDVLVALGTTVAYAFSVAQFFLTEPGHVYFESSAVILTLVLLGKMMERSARSQATRAMEELLSLQPEQARILLSSESDESQTETLDVRLVNAGDRIVVYPGERIPLDGTVDSGVSETDDSLVTGEFAPVTKSAGHSVFSGSLNLNGRLIVLVSREVNRSSVARIMQLVEDAQNSRAPVQSLVDRVSAIFVPGVVAISIIAFLVSYFLGLGINESIVRGVAVLVIACPCALGLASPIAIVIATGMSARNGILFRNAMALEISGRIRTVFFDKTGTLTSGKPHVVSVHASGDRDELLDTAYSVELGSEHPLSAAILEYCESQGNQPRQTIVDYSTVAGAGIQASAEDGSVLIAGTSDYLNDLGISTVDSTGAGSVVHVARNGNYLGYLLLQDTVRPDAENAIEALRSLGIEPLILTGDRPEAARPIAEKLGIDFRAGLKPEDKLSVIGEWKQSPTGMVGDGINDAPALQRADAGFAMGSGTDVAAESADVTLMGDNPMEVVDAIRLSRATIRKIYQNLFFAFIYNITGIPLAALGYLSPMVAGAAMALSSVSVVVSSLTLYRFRFQIHTSAKPSAKNSTEP